MGSIEIGKYTLESLTTGMYTDPKIVYREYIQNSVDALETAVEEKIIEKQSMRIEIIINEENSFIIFKDNGTGISQKDARSTLLNIGNSQKRHSNNRGFRGIGRLGGMSYCNTLLFTTSCENEAVKTIITFDCKKLRALLVPGTNENYNLSAVIDEITTISTAEEKKDRHYFCVEMHGVSGFSDLLNINEVKKYISQVAPIPYKSKSFYRVTEILKHLSSKGYNIEVFPIFIGEDENDLQPVYKRNKNRFHADRSKMKEDDILDINFFDVIVDNELLAIGWYARCEWLGSISEKEISGLRVRKGNILIGDSKTLNSIFREPRFNAWVQGELFILSDKLIPNARRDDFEQNDTYLSLIKTLYDGVGLTITKAIREASTIRNDNSAKVIYEVKKQVEEAEATLNKGFNSSVDKAMLIETLEKTDEKLKKTKVRDNLKVDKENLRKKLSEAIDGVSESSNYKINQINTGIDRKSKKILEIVSDILSSKLSKFLVDEILEELINTLNRK